MKILVLEKNRESLDSLRQALEPLGHTLQFADCEAAGLDFFGQNPVDCVFIAMNIDGEATVAAIKALRSLGKEFWFPIIALCNSLDDDNYAGAILAGADAVVSKPIRPNRVLMQLIALERIYLARQNLQANKDLLAANLALLKLSMYDETTGLPNKRYFEENLEKEFRLARRNISPLTLMMCEMGESKCIKAGLSENGSRPWLQNVAKVIQGVPSRPTDLVCRIDDAVFALILPNTPEAGANRVAEMLADALKTEMEVRSSEARAQTPLFHIASVTDTGKNETASDLVESALKSLQAVKKTNFVLRNM